MVEFDKMDNGQKRASILMLIDMLPAVRSLISSHGFMLIQLFVGFRNAQVFIEEG